MKLLVSLELCTPDGVLTLTAALMDFLDPVRRFADAAAAPVKRRNAHVACLRLPFAVCTKYIISRKWSANFVSTVEFS
jgi:hypothetical protein